jgi:hypothetical protein
VPTVVLKAAYLAEQKGESRDVLKAGQMVDQMDEKMADPMASWMVAYLAGL